MIKTTETVIEFTNKLCETLRENYRQYRIESHRHYIAKGDNVDYHKEQIDELCMGNGVPVFTITKGKKYLKVIMKDYNQSSAHLFVDQTNGDVFKPASFKAPAKGVRYNLLDDKSRKEMLTRADWAGSYLYK
jgi:hypothetical protein